ncbi:hypothetical protein C7B65_21680 [Phormidesmis priestleyi ULC007]|uniref:Uncharacterized protein n=1 Tax=Phormidesmis priestleyi ULC007 TaxID=1920490 RepID=A0A2T1D7L1_9CYAN|nr:hypothetical protein C7B65_21680 [Phormidesmis priestleyi ULC007]PZO47339.1 MAG: hypothetical protein DCF14_20170 [Phormidesmis priestleyi]
MECCRLPIVSEMRRLWTIAAFAQPDDEKRVNPIKPLPRKGYGKLKLGVVGRAIAIILYAS